MKKFLLLTALAVAGLALFAAPALASAQAFYVHPSGGNDTVAIQEAFNDAVAAGPGSIVQLTGGQFYTNAIFARNFDGTFRGAGQGKTFIDTALGNPQIKHAAPLGPVTLDNKGKEFLGWPTLFCFAGGNVRASDMTVSISAFSPARPWYWWDGNQSNQITSLGVVFQVTGTDSAAFSRITFDTAQPGDDGGFNVDTDVQASGPIRFDKNGQPTNLPTIGGSVTIGSCSFNGQIGVFVAGLTHGTFTLGGSPAAGNVFSDTYLGLDCSEESASQNVISYNRMDAGGADIWLGQGAWAIDQAGAPLPALPAPNYQIADNELTCSGDAVVLADWYDYATGTKDLAATVFGNHLDLGSADSPADSGIAHLCTQNIQCWGNRFSGYADTGITSADVSLADGSYRPESGLRIIGNDFRDLTTSTASVYLGMGTTRCLVVGGPPPTTVVNKGTDNTLINVTLLPVPATSMSALSMRANVASSPKLGLLQRLHSSAGP